MDASSALHTTGLRPDKSARGSGRSGASPCGFESGDSNLSKLTNVFATMQLTGPDVSFRLIMPIPLAINLGETVEANMADPLLFALFSILHVCHCPSYKLP
jgi:hypothetical protein